MTRAYLDIYTASVVRSWRASGSLITSLLFFCLILFVFSFLWDALTNGGTRLIEGYTYSSVLWYLMATEAVVFAAPGRHIESIAKEIADGTVETEMLRPSSVSIARLATAMGESTVQLVYCWMAGGILVAVLAGPPPSLSVIPLVVVSSFLAVVLNHAGIHMFAATTFWVPNVTSTWFLYQKIIFLPGGVLMPIQMLPDWLQSVVWATPFWAMAYAPGRLMAGHKEATLLLGQSLWVIALLGLVLFMFSRGERKLVQAS